MKGDFYLSASASDPKSARTIRDGAALDTRASSQKTVLAVIWISEDLQAVRRAVMARQKRSQTRSKSPRKQRWRMTNAVATTGTMATPRRFRALEISHYNSTLNIRPPGALAGAAGNRLHKCSNTHKH
jgi:hypothetical protein